MTADSVVRGTLRGLAQPKRLAPILAVSASLVFAQARYSPTERAIPIAALACVAFVLVAPVSFRLLFPRLEETPGVVSRLLMYCALAAAVNVTLEVLLPRWLGLGRTFLADPVAVGVSLALFLAGGWGLGRDIALEATLAAERARGEALAKEAEAAQLMALRSHFDPHFLFNTLNAIAEWCREDGETAEKAILTLSSMLREVLGGVSAPSWPLARELSLLDALFSLHSIRDADAFTVSRDVDVAERETPIVPMLLLPLAENAVKHGPRAGHPGIIALSVRRGDHGLAICLENPGGYRGPREGSLGLPLVRRRLAAAYGDGGRLVIEEAPGDATRTRVTLTIPSSWPSKGVSV